MEKGLVNSTAEDLALFLFVSQLERGPVQQAGGTELDTKSGG